MMLTIEWHPFNTYEWWSQIGTGLLSFIAAAIIGAVSTTVAIVSVVLTQRARREARELGAVARADRYRDQLVRVIEPAISELVTYGNIVFAEERVGTAKVIQQRATAVSRLLLVSSVAEGADRETTRAIAEAFANGQSFRWQVRVQVAGRIAEALAVFLRAEPDASVADDVRDVWAEEEEQAVKRERAAAEQSAELARERAEMDAEDAPSGLNKP